MRWTGAFATVVAATSLLVGCGDDEPTSLGAPTAGAEAGPASPGEVAEPELRDELLAMLEADQEVRADMDADWDAVDSANQERLAEIFDEHGWPGWSLVGEDGSTAAWAIVQHADLDLDFQRRGLELLEAAVDAGDASPGDLAYLTDRVLVAEGKPQVYGTQWGASADGELEPRTPIEDEANVDERRAAAGLSTLDEYLEELQAATG